MTQKYETIVGLEIHAQLATNSKMFCSCSTTFGAKPNTNICPICTGQPGVLPVTNKKAIELAIKTALALNCRIEPSSVFARKNYFYPDLPKNYQVSQYELPLATNGHIDLQVNGQTRRIGITRVHLEEDAGKLVHKGTDLPAGRQGRIMGAEESLVDYNRTGVPLMEIVSEPDIRTPQEAAIYTQTLANLLQYIGVCDAKMEEGSLRCDANVSIRPFGQEKFGTKTEVKNMNSFKAVEKALLSEVKRHTEVIDDGGKIIQETRFFDEVTETTTGMRSKEMAHDYRYFPEPDLVPVEPSVDWVNEIRQNLGELPQDREKRFINSLGIPAEVAHLIITDKPMADYLEETYKIFPKGQIVANWLVGDITAYLKEAKQALKELPFPPDELAELLKLIEAGTLSGKLAKTVLFEALKSGKKIKEVVVESGLTQINSEDEISTMIAEIIKNNPKQVAEYKGGKEVVLTFFVGQVMKASKGRVNPAMANQLLKKALA